MTTCDACGAVLDINIWPWCPHGRGGHAVIGDEIPGGQMFENGFDRPMRFDSHSAHRRALAERGLEICAKHAGPNDTICPRWDSVDLEGARDILARHAHTRIPATPPERWPRATEPITVTIAGPIRQRDLP